MLYNLKILLFYLKIYVNIFKTKFSKGSSDMKKENFLDSSLLINYPSEDYHRVYVYEIVSVFEQE